MYIGSLINKLSPPISFTKIATFIPLPPDSGNSAFPISYNWDTLLGTGVDITVSFPHKIYCDTVVLNFSENKLPEYIEIYKFDESFHISTEKIRNVCTANSIVVGIEAKTIVIRLHAAYNDLALDSMDIIGGIFDEPAVYPTPYESHFDGTYTNISAVGAAVTYDGEDACFAAGIFKDDFPIVGEYPISFITDSQLGCEEYRIVADSTACKVYASSRRGFVYAANTLLTLCQGGKIHHGEIFDLPLMEFRGVHIGLPSRTNIPFTKRLIKNLLAPMRYNSIIIEVAAGMRFERHPEINEMWRTMREKSISGEWPEFRHHLDMVCGGGFLEKDEIHDLVSFAESYGLDVIPEVQALSHVQYLTKCHPEIAEIPEGAEDKYTADLRLADVPTDEFYPSCYCPSNEMSYTLVFDVLDEVLEVFKPKKYVHMGHDEVYKHGVCSKCKNRSFDEIFASDVTRYRDYLNERGLRMMIWGDMINDINWYACPGAIDLIPKDVVLLDFIWYFDFERDTENRLLEHGFDVVMGNMYSSHYPRYETRREKKHILGAEVSTWVSLDEKTLSFEGKLFDFIYSAQMMWSSGYDMRARRTYTRIISDFLPDMRSRLIGGLPSRGGISQPLLFSAGGGNIPSIIRSALPTGRISIHGIEFDLEGSVAVSSPDVPDLSPESVKIALYSHADSLVFLYAAGQNAKRTAWQPMTSIGECIVSYTNGTHESFDIEYGYNIYDIHEKYAAPLSGGYYRHEGYSGTYAIDAAICEKAADGTDITVSSYEWVNPHPDRDITTVLLHAKGDSGVPIWLFGLTAIKKNTH